MFSTLDLQKLCSNAESAARAAGDLLDRSRASKIVVEDLRRDIKLNVDVETEDEIIDILSGDIPILCEENGWIGASAETYWIVDGLDGTVNYSHEIPLSCVSIGLIVNGISTVGVIYDYVHEEMFTGIVGLGSFLNGVPIQVNDNTDVSKALLLTALSTKSEFSSRSLFEFVQGLAQWRKVRMLGTAALSMAYVAAGRADACQIKDIMFWDVAAGIAIVNAAGGRVATEFSESNTLDINADNGVLKAGV
jgi:myo-inositol-1(or 4)-monophosphatase